MSTATPQLTTAERVRFRFAGVDLVGDVIDTDWRPGYNAQERLHVTIRCGNTTYTVRPEDVTEIVTP